MSSEKYKINMGVGSSDIRYIREGGDRHTQIRTVTTYPDGTIEYGEWRESGTLLGYYDFYDKKPISWPRDLCGWGYKLRAML